MREGTMLICQHVFMARGFCRYVVPALPTPWMSSCLVRCNYRHRNRCNTSWAATNTVTIHPRPTRMSHNGLAPRAGLNGGAESKKQNIHIQKYLAK